MANLKSIVDLPMAENTKGVNLIIEDNGVAKKIAADNAGLGGTSDAVQYVEQTLTEEQQMQTRKNLGLYYTSEEKSLVPIIEEGSSVDFFGSSSTSFEATGKIPAVGDTVIVVFEGEEYECIVANETMYTWEPSVGNFYLFNSGYEDTGEPFFMRFGGQDGNIEVYFYQNVGVNGSYSLSASTLVAEPITIPDKYIPDTIMRKSDMPNGVVIIEEPQQVLGPQTDGDVLPRLKELMAELDRLGIISLNYPPL